ncbi:MAG TPA: AraC family transcriptional regulator [Polyangiaceae bacterium]|nr:AraC family transcriptional regulator [Polyangiaceae bacterium]
MPPSVQQATGSVQTGVMPGAKEANRDTSALTSWGLAIARALQARGHEPHVLFARAGLDVAALGDPDARYPVTAMGRLWRLAVEETRDPCFGLEVARNVAPTTFHALGFAILSSTTLREVFDRVVRYFRLVSDAASMSFERVGETYRFAVTATHGEPPAVEAIDALFAVAVRLARLLTDRRFSPLLVELRRSAPPDSSPFARCFRAPVVFGAAADALTLERGSCEQRLRGANPEVARLNDQAVTNALGRMRSARATDRVKAAVVDRLPSGEPSQHEIARAVGTSTRALQRRLAAEGTTYSRVVDETRHGLATQYLLDDRYSLTEIAYLLGFSGGNNFTRAFRRWEGESPSEYRTSRQRRR